jgi:hypothetical protein
MEPLVIFGAGLVVWCGYLSILDSVRVCRLLKTARTPIQAPAKKCQPPAAAERRSRPMVGIGVGRPLLNRA